MNKKELEEIKAAVEEEESTTTELTPEDDVWAEQVQELAAEHDKYAKRPGETALTSGLGAATFGISNKLIKALGIRSEEDLRKLRHYNENAALAGTVAGVVAPAILSGGSSAVAQAGAKGFAKGAARMATAPGQMAIKAGKLTEKAVEKALRSKGTKSAVKDIIKTGVTKGAGSTVEGAAFGLGMLMDEASIGESDFNAENIMSYGGLGALYGGAIGTALPMVGTSIAKATGAGKNAFGQAAKKFISPADDAADLVGYTPSMKARALTDKKEAKLLADLPRWLRDNVGWKVSDNAQSRLNKLTQVGENSGKRIDEILEEADLIASSSAVDDASKRLLEHRRKRLFEDLADKLEQQLKDKMGSISSKNTARQSLERLIKDLRAYTRPKIRVEKVRKEIKPEPKVTTSRETVKRDGDLVQNKYSTKTVVGNEEKVETFIETIKGDAVVKTEKIGEKIRPITKKYKTVTRKIVEDPNKKPMTAKEIRQLRNTIWDEFQNLSFEARGSLSGSILSRAYGSVAESLEDFVRKAAPGLEQELKKANYNYSLFKKFEQPLAKRTAKDSNMLNFRDLLFGGVGYGVGGEIGILAAGARKLYQSDIKKKIVVLSNMEKANKQNMKKMSDSVNNFFKGKSKPAKLALFASLMESELIEDKLGRKPSEKKQALQNLRNNLNEMIMEPENLERRVARANSVVSAAAPNTAQAVAETLSRAVFFLNSKIPKPAYEIPFGRKDWEPSSLDLAKFERYFEVANNPMAALRELEAGTLTREHVEALEAVYPRLYDELRYMVLKKVKDAEAGGSALAYAKKVQLGILLNIPTDSSLVGAQIASLQAKYAMEKEAQMQTSAPGPRPRGKAEALNMAERGQTEAQRVAEKE